MEILGGAAPRMIALDALQSQFRQLRLVETASELPELLRKAEQASWTYRELVQEIVCSELRKARKKVFRND